MRLEINPTHTHRITQTHSPFLYKLHTHIHTHTHPDNHAYIRNNSIVKWCTLLHHQIIVHHTAARGLIALSIEHRQNDRKGAGREGEKRMDTEIERTFDKIA